MSDAGPAKRDLLLEGGEALRCGAWAEAREHFEAALRERETPQALEGLGMAAQWLVDRETVFLARERAYRLYRESNSPRDAARVAIQLAWDYRTFRGEAAIATGWLQRAHDLLSNEEPSSEHGWLALREASVLLTNGQLAAARELTSNAVELGRSLSDVDLEMTALALDGLVLVNEGKVAEGMRRLDGSAAAIVGLGQGQGLGNTQSATPDDCDERPHAQSVRIGSGSAHHRDDLLRSWRVRRIAHAPVLLGSGHTGSLASSLVSVDGRRRRAVSLCAWCLLVEWFIVRPRRTLAPCSARAHSR